MPPRRKPTSTTAKKAQQKLNRAIKRGEVDASTITTSTSTGKPKQKRKKRVGPTGQALNQQSQKQINATEASKKLQSSFVKPSKAFLEKTTRLAGEIVLGRPIREEAAVFDEKIWTTSTSTSGSASGSGESTSDLKLSCPKRPKWNFDMSKKQVEANEEGIFRQWLEETDTIVERWRAAGSQSDIQPSQTRSADRSPSAEETMPRSTTYFERNLEVWRQLWRVTEISQILLVLLDARCPLLHFPPSLQTYLTAPVRTHTSTSPHTRRIIFVLTKVDITGPQRAAAWARYLEEQHPGIPVVQVESYHSKDDPPGGEDGQSASQNQNQSQRAGRAYHEPGIPSTARDRLVDVIRDMHKELLQPPQSLRGTEREKTWRAKGVKRDVDWEMVRRAEGEKAGMVVGGSVAPKPASDQEDERDGDEEGEPEFLTIGLIGQPNVGKSSLLNALFGVNKVRASRTPGKTKHFQTHFWTPQVRLVDCPGLVLPNLVPLEMQIMLGTFPIARVSAIPSSVHNAAQLLPLEHILSLHSHHPDSKRPVVEDKRTYREDEETRRARLAARKATATATGGEGEGGGEGERQSWTTMDILTAFADKKGWVTAKAGRSDVNRTGNAILRYLAEGRIAWGFYPPGTLESDLPVDSLGKGIWIADRQTAYDEDDDAKSVDPGSDDEGGDLPSKVDGEARHRYPEEDGSDGEMDEEDDSVSQGDGDEDNNEAATGTPAGKKKVAPVSRFAMLELDEAESDGDEGDESGSDE